MAYYGEDEQQIGKREGVDAMIDTESVSDAGPRMPTGTWRTEGQGVADASAQGTRAWQELAQRQAMNAHANAANNNAAFAAQFYQLNDRINNAAALQQENAEKTLLVSADMASRNGRLPLGLIGAIDGQIGGNGRFAGGQWLGSGMNRKYVTYRKDPNGRIVEDAVVPLAKIVAMSRKYPGLMSQEFDQTARNTMGSYMTQDQMNAAFGPSTPYTVGTTNISGSLTNRLLGRPQPRSKISWFSADGKGGGSRGEVNGRTGERWEEDWGARQHEEEQRRADLAAKVADANSGNRMKIEQMKEQGKNERLDKKIAEGKESRKETQEERNKNQYENAIATREYRDREYIRKIRAETLRGSLSESQKYTDEYIASEEKRLADEREAYKARLKKQYGIKDDAPEQGQAEPQKADNGGDGSSVQYKQGDEHEINGVKMRLVPSSKDPNKLVWKRI